MKRWRWRLLGPGVAALVLGVLCPGASVVLGQPAGPAAADVISVRQAGNVEIIIDGDVIVGRPAEITIRAANPVGDANQGSITVSLPGNPNIEIAGASAPGAKLFQPGEQMFSFAAARNATIQVPAVELFVSSWPPGTRHELKLRVAATTPYTLQARASFRRASGGFVHLPANGQVDQQGAPTRLIDVAPRQPAPPTRPPAPPTEPPAPTATLPPPPTPVPPTATTALAKPNNGDTQGAATPPTVLPAQAAAPPPAAPPLGPAAAPTATLPPLPPGAPTAPEQAGGPSLPLLLAGLGIMAVGIAIGLLAILLVVRRTSGPPRYTGMPAPVPPMPYGFGGPPGPGQQPSWPPTTPGPSPYGSPGYGAGYGQPSPPWGTPAPPDQTARRPDPSGSYRPDHDSTARPPSHPDTSLSPAPGSQGDTGKRMAQSSSSRYVDRVLKGRGGMGSVYKAYDARLQRSVALKIMHPDLGLQPGFIERFIREAQVAALLEHPNIVTVYDIEQVGDSIQMVMSWIDGEDLQQLLEREGALQPDRTSYLLTQMAAALDHAHLRARPVLHRDIKPSNIMIGQHERVVLTDFGIARIMGDVALTQVGQMVGTPAFMAPEVVRGADFDHRADVYALGVVLYQMLTGRAPFRAETPMALLHAQVNTPPPPPRSFAPLLPAAVDAVVLQALAKNPDERFQTAGDLARAFARAVGRR